MLVAGLRRAKNKVSLTRYALRALTGSTILAECSRVRIRRSPIEKRLCDKLTDQRDTAGVTTNGSAQVVSNNLVDLFGVMRYEQGSAQTPWRWRNIQSGEEKLVANGGFASATHSGITVQVVPLPWLLGAFGIGVAICLYQAYRETNRPGIESLFPDGDPAGWQRHCFLCCRIVRCTLGLGPDLALKLQVLWELMGWRWPDSGLDTIACTAGIELGYRFRESCLTGCTGVDPTRYLLNIFLAVYPVVREGSEVKW